MNAHRMRASKTCAAVLLASACAALAAWAPPGRVSRAQPQEGVPERRAESRSAIYGRAVSESTGRPLRRVGIMLMTTDGSRVDRIGLTDARGEFRIGGLPAGRYVVWADLRGMLTPAILNSSGDISDPEMLRRHFEVVELDGRAEREVTVRARRGAAIAGRITSADGEPATSVIIHILRREGGRLTTMPPSAFGIGGYPHADDRGVYRAVGLPPGEYVVAVSEAADHSGAGDARAPSSGLPGMADLVFNQQLLLTYHPSATSVKEAETISLGAGEEHADVNVTIPDRELRTVAGVVRAARGGRPLRGAKVYISPKDEGGVPGENPFFDEMGGSTADADGRWRLREIPDGLYTIHVKPPDEREPDGEAAEPGANRNARNMNAIAGAEDSARDPVRRKRFAPLRRELRVSGDVGELVLELAEGGRVSGSVHVEGGKDHPFMYIYARRLAKTLMESAGDSSPSAQVNGGTFELEGLTPGKYFLHARDFSDEGGFYLKAMTWQGRDLLREPLEVGEGAQVEGVRVVYGTNPAALVVRVYRAGKQPAYNVNVFLLPADLSHWSVFRSPLLCSTGVEGFCRLSAPPGDYVVITAGLTDLFDDPEQELRRRALGAPRITLRAGEEKTLETVIKE